MQRTASRPLPVTTRRRPWSVIARVPARHRLVGAVLVLTALSYWVHVGAGA